MAIIFTLHDTIALRRDHRLRVVCLNVVQKIVRVIAFVGQYCLRRHPFQQRFTLRNVSNFTTSQQPAHRIAQGVYHRVNLAGQSAARTTDRLRTFFFWAPAACWWARTAVLSIINASRSRSPLTDSTKRCHTPVSPQRLKRVYVVCQLPNSAGKSRHGEPVRTIHNTASKNRRLSCAVAPGSPGLPGNRGSSFTHWSSRNSLLLSRIFGIHLFKYRM
jgi:hypothetical protein